MPSPEISVIVPVYNTEKYLRRCVDSILAQTYTDFELLLIDDGSTDGSPAICDEYAALDPRVRVFHKPNGGVSSARNLGLDHARGQWITFVDSDDYVFSCWLDNYNLEEAKDVDLIQQGAESDKPIWMTNKSSQKCGFDYFGDPYGYLDLLMCFKMVGYPWMKAFRLDIICRNNLCFDENIISREDEVFLFQYLNYCKKIKSVNKQGYFYFVPEWRGKYFLNRDAVLYLEKTQADACDTTFSKMRSSRIVRFYKDIYIYSLMCGFSRKPKLYYLTEIQRLHKIDYNCSRLFKPLRWLIVKDPTYLLSWLGLFIHSNLRKLFKN